MSSASTAAPSSALKPPAARTTGFRQLRPLERLAIRVGMVSGAVIFLTNPSILDLHLPAAIQTPINQALGLAAYPLQGELVLLVLISLLGGWLLNLANRPRIDDPALWELLQVEWRFVLAAAMLLSGLEKVLHVQFPWPTPPDWIRPLREMPSLYYVHIWIGSSGLHETMLGLTELAAAVALLFMRTTTLGGLIALMSVGNAVMIALSFDDIRVGSYWPLAQLAALALLPVVTSWRRIVTFFAFESQAPAPPRTSHQWTVPALQRAERFAKPTFLAFVAALAVPTIIRGLDLRHRSTLRGAYTVERFLVNGQTVDPFSAEPRWRLVGIDDCRRFAIRTQDDRQLEAEIVTPGVSSLRPHAECTEATSAPNGSLTLRPTKLALGLVEPRLTGEVRYARDGDLLRLEGTIDGKTVTASLRRIADSTFRVTRYPNSR